MRELLSYCIDFLRKNVCELKEDYKVWFALPYPFVPPNRKIFDKDQFYWDSYFEIRGLKKIGETELARGMVKNALYMLNRFGLVPSRNRYYNVGTSQPPFLALMIKEVFPEDREQLLKKAKEELKYWKDEFHLVRDYKLSRYCDHYVMHETAEHESGWDMTWRFDARCLDFLPVDLNSLLASYEEGKDFEERKERILDLFYDPVEDFFFDYDFVNKTRRRFYSVAGFYPLFLGLVDKSDGKRILKKGLKALEAEYGIVNTEKVNKTPFKQHDYPNGWPHQQVIVVEALKKYGLYEDADRIRSKWLKVVWGVYEDTGKVWEKYNVTDGDIGKSGRYPTQEGFGWSCASVVEFSL